MVAINMMTASDMRKLIAKNACELRLSQNLSQKTLSERSGVSYGTLKKFEQTGNISLESLLKIAIVLGAMSKFNELFAVEHTKKFLSLDELIKTEKRKRGRK